LIIDVTNRDFQNNQEDYVYILNAVDVFSRKCFLEPTKKKSAVDIRDAFKAIDNGIPSIVWAGTVEDNIELEICNSLGETDYGDVLENIQEITCVEVQK
jgi:hypothetical protein